MKKIVFAALSLVLCYTTNSSAAILKDVTDSLAIYKIMNMSNPDLSLKTKHQYYSAIMKYSKKESIDPKLIAAIVHTECNFDSKRVSKKGARGPMGIIPKYHKETLKDNGIKNVVSINGGVHAGTIILKQYLREENWNLRKALKKYGGFVKKSPYIYYNKIIMTARM